MSADIDDDDDDDDDEIENIKNKNSTHNSINVDESTRKDEKENNISMEEERNYGEYVNVNNESALEEEDLEDDFL